MLLKCSSSKPPTLEPVPIVVFIATHPTSRIRDAQGLLQHGKIGGSWLPIAQTVFSCGQGGSGACPGPQWQLRRLRLLLANRP